MYINATDFIRVKEYLNPELLQELKNTNVIMTQDEKKYRLFLQVDTEWVKQARQVINKNSMFDVIKNGKTYKLPTTKKVGNIVFQSTDLLEV